MSAIVGIYYRDDRPVDRTDLERMAEILAHRGPDGTGIWNEGSVGLGHRMLWTTPESLHEQLPLVSETGNLVITADARIDNRDELIVMLGFTDHPLTEITDSQLILAVYKKWGDRCPEMLLGDFSFAIWDGRQQTLFCARDHFGVKPFYYYSSDRTFAFASEIKALLRLPEVGRQLNEARVADYLASTLFDTTITFYQDIFRLSPSHRMTIGYRGMQMQRYWSLDPSHELRLDSNAAYAEMFRDHFAEAVRCRLRSVFPLGSLLSGGLDSSSVTGVAQRFLCQNGGGQLRTFSAVFEEMPSCDERPFIDAILTQGGLAPHFVRSDQLGPLTDFDRILWYQDEVFDAPNLAMTWRLHSAAAKHGVRVLLKGHDGDTTVSHGIGYLQELARAGRWLNLVVEARGLDKTFDTSFTNTIWHYIRAYRLDPVLSGSRAFRFSRRMWRAMLRRARRECDQSSNLPPRIAILNPDFVQHVRLRERYKESRQYQPSTAENEREAHFRAVTHSIQPTALEVLDRAAMAFSIEPRYPFWDKRLVEFCLSLPPEQKLNRGWSRIVLRRAMDGILPVEIQWRRGKTNFLPSFSHRLLTYERKRLDELILSGSKVIEQYVNITALHKMYHRYVSHELEEKPQEVLAIWRAASLALWLNNAGLNELQSVERR